MRRGRRKKYGDSGQRVGGLDRTEEGVVTEAPPPHLPTPNVRSRIRSRMGASVRTSALQSILLFRA